MSTFQQRNLGIRKNVHPNRKGNIGISVRFNGQFFKSSEPGEACGKGKSGIVASVTEGFRKRGSVDDSTRKTEYWGEKGGHGGNHAKRGGGRLIAKDI